MADEPSTAPLTRLFVREWAKTRGLDQKRLAERMGIEPGTLSKLLAGKMEMTLEYLGRIAAALDVPPVRLFRDPAAPFSADDLTDEDLKAAEVYSRLDDPDKDAVLQLAVRLLPPSPEER